VTDPLESLAEGTQEILGRALTERERADIVFGIKVELDSQDLGGRLKAGMPVTLEIELLS